MRGTPVGRQLASGSSFDWRDLKIFSAAGVIGITAPLGIPWAISPTGPPPCQTPERSTVPSARWGVGPLGRSGARRRGAAGPAAVAASTLPPAGATAFRAGDGVV